MVELHAWLAALAPVAAVCLGGWLWSLVRDRVDHVDVLWPLLFLVAACTYFAGAESSARAQVVLLAVAVWAIRLAVHLGRRLRGEEAEDHRYQAIRANHGAAFRYKSLYIVFGLQGLLAWLISAPLLAAMGGGPLGLLDGIAVLAFGLGLGFEWIADRQLRAFRAEPSNRGRVLDSGLWRYSRHPNYFGEACTWWAFYLFALAAGFPWTVFAPLVMTLLLVKVSGVALLERSIVHRRQGYADYVARTSAFIPWPPRPADHANLEDRP